MPAIRLDGAVLAATARYGCACFDWLFEAICRSVKKQRRHASWCGPGLQTIEWRCSY